MICGSEAVRSTPPTRRSRCADSPTAFRSTPPPTVMSGAPLAPMSRNGVSQQKLSQSPSRIRIAGRSTTRDAKAAAMATIQRNGWRVHLGRPTTPRGRPGDRRRPAYREAERVMPSPRTTDGSPPSSQSDERPLACREGRARQAESADGRRSDAVQAVRRIAAEPFRKKVCDRSRSRALYTGRAEKRDAKDEPTVTTNSRTIRCRVSFGRPRDVRAARGPATSRTGTLERGMPSPRTGDGPTPCGQSDESPQPFRKKVGTDRGLEPSIQIGVKKRRATTSRP